MRHALGKFGLGLALRDVDDANIAQDVAPFGRLISLRGDLGVEFREPLHKCLCVRVAQWFGHERRRADVHVSIW